LPTPTTPTVKEQIVLRLLDILATLVQTSIPWVGAGWMAYMIYLSVDALAGRKTAADFGIKVIGNVEVNRAVAWLLVALFGGTAYRERRLRQKNIERLAPSVAQKEKVRDPKRSSSNLTSRGKTRPEDKP
jgi:hypothetical protein